MCRCNPTSWCLLPVAYNQRSSKGWNSVCVSLSACGRMSVCASGRQSACGRGLPVRLCERVSVSSRGTVCVFVCACLGLCFSVRVCVCPAACVRAGVCVCVHACTITSIGRACVRLCVLGSVRACAGVLACLRAFVCACGHLDVDIS